MTGTFCCCLDTPSYAMHLPDSAAIKEFIKAVCRTFSERIIFSIKEKCGLKDPKRKSASTHLYHTIKISFSRLVMKVRKA